MRVVVTGAAGFLGRAVMGRLQATGVSCVGLSRRDVPGLRRVADYGDAPEAEVLVHLAQTNDRAAANVAGDGGMASALETVEALAAKGHRRIVYASSAALYGDGSTRPHPVTDPTTVVDAYTRTKYRSEESVLGRGGVVARLSNLYGPGMAAGNVLGQLLAQLGRGPTITMHSLEPVRDFLWVEDAARALCRMVESDTTGVFNVATGVGTSIRELVHMALAKAGSGQSVVALHALERPSHLVLDIAGTTAALGWEPEVGIEEGVGELVNLMTKSERTQA